MRLYDALPPRLQNAAVGLYAWRTERYRYGGAYDSIWREVQARGGMSAEQVLAYRDERVRRFIAEATRAADHYRAFDGARGVSELPIITKRDVQGAEQSFTSPGEGEARIILHTSGTTGAGLRFPATRAAVQEQWAVWWRYRQSHGIEPGTLCGYFGGREIVPIGRRRPPFHRMSRPGRQVMFSAYHLSRDTVVEYVRALDAARPPWLHGYPSVLSTLAGLMQERNLALSYVPRWITVGAESLLPAQKALIESTFGCAPLQHYGLAEAVANLSECERGMLHVDEDFAAVEFVPSEGGLRIVGTNMSNSAFPLLRYDTGDIASGLVDSCRCGRPGRAVESIDGRIEDCVVLSDGRTIGRLDHAFKDLVRIREAQLLQTAPNTIVVRVVPGRDYDDDDKASVVRALQARLGAEVDVRVEEVDEIPRTHSGKLRFVVNLVGDRAGSEGV